jgi:DNA recombination protein RmuC
MLIALCATVAILAILAAFFFYRFVSVRAELATERALASERVAVGEMLRDAARTEFSMMASKLIEDESRASEENLGRLLGPFKERLKDFEKKVEDAYSAEGRERYVLKAEVERLIALNEHMTRETNQLTQALKGDSKVQGDWGETILENILTASGLREGLEYTKQDVFENDAGEKLRPDLLIRLPDDKQIIVDSKVSLKAYEAYTRAETPDEREHFLNAHLESVRAHVDGLAEKHYPRLKGLRTPEFVFLFAPIEPAYLLAMRHDPELATRAWKKGIAVVTSTTLFTSLKTVASIWRLEHQNRNAQEIAEEAAKLYDKFVGFHDDFEKVGRLLEQGSAQYNEARRKLRDGPGNVFRKIEQLRELGAAPNKRIRPELLEE